MIAVYLIFRFIIVVFGMERSPLDGLILLLFNKDIHSYL